MKSNEFYCVSCRHKVTLPAKDIHVATLRNGKPALRGNCKKCKTNLTKFIKVDDVSKMKKLFRSRGRSPRSRSRKRSKVRSMSRKRSKVRSKSRRRSKSRSKKM